MEMGMFPDLYSFPDQFIEIEASPTVAYPDQGIVGSFLESESRLKYV